MRIIYRYILYLFFNRWYCNKCYKETFHSNDYEQTFTGSGLEGMSFFIGYHCKECGKEEWECPKFENIYNK